MKELIREYQIINQGTGYFFLAALSSIVTE